MQAYTHIHTSTFTNMHTHSKGMQDYTQPLNSTAARHRQQDGDKQLDMCRYVCVKMCV